jgi:cytochrome c biogenesis protein
LDMPHGSTSIMERAAALFSSLRLAVVLLVVLASVSAVGTLIPQEQAPQLYLQRYGEDTYHYLKLSGLVDLYHSWGFRALMSLLTANLLVCTARRMKGVYRRTLHPVVEKSEEGIRALRVSNELPSPDKLDVLVRVLSEKKYRIRRQGCCVHASKGITGPWGDMITHASILLVLLGALVGSLGFVGTVYVYEGASAREYYNWSELKDEGLGFELFVDKFALKFYPAGLKIEARRRGDGEKAGVFDTKEGGAFIIPDSGYTVLPEKVDADSREIRLKIYEDGKVIGIYDTGQADGGAMAPPMFEYSFDLLASQDPILMSVASTVRLVKDGATVKRGIVEINSPLRYDGLTIYQTAYNKDETGRFYSGFQIVRDPGIPLVWAGFAMLLVGLFLSFNFHHRQVWVCAAPGRLVVGGSTNKDLPGFMREYGGVVRSFMQEVEP